MQWPAVVGILLGALLLAMLPLAWLYGRRRWLSREGETFDCSLRSLDGSWVLGAGRYREDDLEWFPIFSLTFSPQVVFARRVARAVATREVSPAEAAVLLEGQQVVQIRSGVQECELAMDPQCLTGMLSWLEAAPPGRERL